MENPVSWDYLTAPVREVPTFGPLSTAFVVLFGLSFVVSAILYMTANRRFADNHIVRRAVHVGTQIIMWLTGVGLFFFAFRVMRVEFLTLYMRIWSYLFFLAYLATLGYFVYWFRVVYPRRRDEVERLRMRRRYSPAVALRRKPKKKARRGIR